MSGESKTSSVVAADGRVKVANGISEEWLMEAAEKGLKIKVPVKALSTDNVREWTQEKAKPIAGSMALYGLLVAIIINTKGVVFDGAGRLLAAMMLGWSEIDATVIKTDLTPSEWKIRQLTTSIFREKLTDGQLYENLMTLVGLRPDWKQVDLAKHLGVDEPTISRWSSPSKTTEKCREALMAGQITFTDTMRLGRLPYEDQDEVLEAKLSGAIQTRNELDRVVRERTKKPGRRKPQKGVNRFKTTWAGVAFTAAAKALGTSELIAAISDLLEQLKEEQQKGHSLKTIEGAFRDHAAKAK